MKSLGLSLLLAGGLVAGTLEAQEGNEQTVEKSTEQRAEVDDVEKRHLRMLELARSYTLKVGDEVVSLREKPVFRWSTPERQAIGGELYLWTFHGRPIATIGVWTYDDIKDSHEVQSLASEPLVAVSPLFPDWRPSAANVEFREVEGVPPPDKSPVRRQTQMRNMLRQKFSGQMTKDNNAQVELRLLPQPLYRYESFPPEVVDGAMFGLAFGTDPEILVLLEARKGSSPSEPGSWYYAFAPSTSAKVLGRVDGVEIWNNLDQSIGNTFRMMINR